MGAVAVSVRLQLLYWIFLCDIFNSTLALPFIPSSIPQIISRDIIIGNNSGFIQVFDTVTEQAIPQGPAIDGSGTNSAVIWLVFCFVIGVPMSIAGIRGWRLTIGVGIGLSATACSWAAFINTITASGVPDLLLIAIVMAFFFLGFVLGLFEFARLTGLIMLGTSGGLAFGIRAMLLKEGLLISAVSLFALNWVLIAFFGILGGISILWPAVQRGGILFGSASIGTFLVSLGIDLIMHRQSGMSRGLRILFDRNPAHLADILTNTYTPQLSTQILLAVSMGLTPVFAYAQDRIFKQPFSRKPSPPSPLCSPISSALRESGFMSIPKAVAKLQARSHFSL